MSEKTLNLIRENQIVNFVASRRGRKGGKIQANTFEEVAAQAAAKGWTGDLVISKIFVSNTKSTPMTSSEESGVAVAEM